MWMIFGLLAIAFTLLNFVFAFQARPVTWFPFAALAFTALTMCSFYADGATRVAAEDWSGLMDIMPTMNPLLWVCVGGSILLNAIPLLRAK